MRRNSKLTWKHAIFGATLLLHPVAGQNATPLKSVPVPVTLQGDIPDSSCQYESINTINSRILPNVQELVKTLYFRYWRVNLWRECQFWKDGMFCTNQNCAVEAAEDNEVPEDYKSAKLGRVDMTGSSGDFSSVFGSCDYTNKDFCVLDNEASSDGVYVNLLENPERYTGYSGEPANRIWKAIYEENCFNLWDGEKSKPVADLAKPEDGMCTERRIFFRLISGFHSAISVGICNDWLNRTSGAWEKNLDCYIWKVGNFPDRIQNIYFNYAVIMRAVSKITPWLKKYRYCTTDKAEDDQVQHLMRAILKETKSCPSTFFDEKQLFADKESKKLITDFKSSFRNISRIMDCVSCDKCKMWGKLQVTGLGTALKILFSLDDNNPSLYRLTRTELVALFNTFARYSIAVNAIEEFKALAEEHNRLVSASQTPDSQTDSSRAEPERINRLKFALFVASSLVMGYLVWNYFGVPPPRPATQPRRVKKTQ